MVLISRCCQELGECGFPKVSFFHSALWDYSKLSFLLCFVRAELGLAPRISVGWGHGMVQDGRGLSPGAG